MPVYDSESIANSKSKFECTYKTFTSNNQTATPDAPILVLDNLSVAFTNDCVGTFTNPYRKTAFTIQTVACGGAGCGRRVRYFACGAAFHRGAAG